MKKFIIIAPYDQKNDLSSMSFIESNITNGEEIRVMVITPDEKQLRDELTSLQAEKGFICRVEAIPITYTGDADTSIELFRKLLPYFNMEDRLYAYISDITPNAIAIVMALEYATTFIEDVSIGAVMCNDTNITSLIRLDETVRLMANSHFQNPIKHINRMLELGWF